MIFESKNIYKQMYFQYMLTHWDIYSIVMRDHILDLHVIVIPVNSFPPTIIPIESWAACFNVETQKE